MIWEIFLPRRGYIRIYNFMVIKLKVYFILRNNGADFGGSCMFSPFGSTLEVWPNEPITWKRILAIRFNKTVPKGQWQLIRNIMFSSVWKFGLTRCNGCGQAHHISSVSDYPKSARNCQFRWPGTFLWYASLFSIVHRGIDPTLHLLSLSSLALFRTPATLTQIGLVVLTPVGLLLASFSCSTVQLFRGVTSGNQL
jgi:hypothetical protein